MDTQLANTILNRKLLTVAILGFSSGLPLGLLCSTLQAWYTVTGASLLVIGWLTLVGQPYAYKFLWAPLLDRFSLFRMARRRGWIVTMQCLLACVFIGMGLCNPVHAPLGVALLALIAAIFSATQDTAIDAYRTELLTENEQGVGVSYNTIFYRIAMIVSTGIALIIAGTLGWKLLYIAMGASFFLLAIISSFSPTPLQLHAHPTTLSDAVIAPWKSFFSKKNALLILLFIVLYKLSDALALSLNTTFLIRGIGFSLVQVGSVSKIIGAAAGITGALAAGLCMTRMSLYRSLWFFGLLQLLSNLLYAWLAVVGKNIIVMGIAMFGENFFSGMATVAFVVFLTRLCDRRFTATQYALFSAVAAIGRIFVGPASAVLVDHMGWCDFYIVTSIVGLPSLLILWWLKAYSIQSVMFFNHKMVDQ